MRKKIWLVLFLIIISINSFGKTIWNGEDGKLRIIYKLLDPLIVKVEDPVKIRANTLEKSFTYSSKNGGNRIKVDVSAPYDSIDNFLREIYKYVYFELENDGNFELTLLDSKIKNNQTTEPIKAKGYFVDESNGILAKDKKSFYHKEFSSRVASSPFTSSTQIDVDFTLPEQELPMGTYRGSMILNVWFGGTIN